MKFPSYRNCAGCGLLFGLNKPLKRIGKVNHGEWNLLFCPSCFAKERGRRRLARIEELQGL